MQFICISSFLNLVNAQQQNRFWYFGDDIGLDFGPGLNNPIPIPGVDPSPIPDEGTGVISDVNGNFLFYTDGNSVINNQGQTVANNLGGNISSTQSSIVVTDPNCGSNYYIFSIGIAANGGLHYDKLNTSTWTIEESGDLCASCVERVTAVPHSNGEDHWIITSRPSSKALVVYALTADGVSEFSNEDLDFLPDNFTTSYGSIKASHDGKLIAVATNAKVDLLTFDNSTGEVTSYLNTFNFSTSYGLEFSPDNNYLFISGLGGNNNSGNTNPGFLRQFNTSAPFDMVNEEIFNDDTSNGYDGGALQLGPDGKIYLARDETNFLDVISNPNSATWGYSEAAITFECTTCVRLGLPNLVGAPNECDPCDSSNSLLPNHDFEMLENEGDEPTAASTPTNSQLEKAAFWSQATEATSDYYSLVSFPTRIYGPSGGPFVEMQMPVPPNDGQRWVGAWGSNDGNVEYIGSPLALTGGEEYTLKMLIGAPANPPDHNLPASVQLPEVANYDLVVLGLPNTDFPISGTDCKEDDFDIIGITSVIIPAFSWREITVSLNPTINYAGIMFGVSCNSPNTETQLTYMLADDLYFVQGEDPCPQACYSVQADSPDCNPEDISFTYEFELINNLQDQSFDKLLIINQDQNGYSLDLLPGQTLVQLDTEIQPGMSANLSWTILGTEYNPSPTTFCFDIAPYNTNGEICCLEQHCVELQSCCPPDESFACELIQDEEGDCCYSFNYYACEDEFQLIELDILTEGLDWTYTVADGFEVTEITAGYVQITGSEGMLPQGEHNNVFNFCIDNISPNTPEEQEIAVRWDFMEAGLFTEVKTIDCSIPDPCVELTDTNLYCGDDGIYYYDFVVTNISTSGNGASILVLGAHGDTEPTDFSLQSFPPFPNNDSNAPAYLNIGDAVNLTVALPNAQIGDTYTFILSLHDYRNLTDEEDYWCCYSNETEDPYVIEVNIDCDDPGVTPTDEPLKHVAYPNPVKDEIYLSFDEILKNQTTIAIQSTSGEVLHIEHAEALTSSLKMDIQKLLPGVYFIVIRDKHGKVNQSMFAKN